MIIILYLVMCLIFGTTFLAIKLGMEAGLPPFFSAGIRFFLAGGIILLFLFFKNKNLISLLWRKELIFTGFTLTFVTFSSLYWAEQYVTSGAAAILSATGPIIIILIQNMFMKVRINLFSMIGILVGFSGVLFLFLPGLSIEWNQHWVLGCGIIIIGEIGYAIGTIYSSKTIIKFNQVPPIVLNAVQMLYGGLFLLLLSLIFGEGLPHANMSGFLSMVYLIIAGSMIGHTIYYYLVAKTNTFFPSTWLYVSPLIALTIGYYFYQEFFHPIMLIGVILILTSLIMINMEKIANLLGYKKSIVVK